MKKTMLLLLAACLVAMAGCRHDSARTETAPGSSEVATAAESVQPEPGAVEQPLPMEGTRAVKYGRLAIVCAPESGSDPKYVPMVLKGIGEKVPKYLAGLQKVNTVPDASVDTNSVPPTVRFKNINDYDALALVTYTYSGPLIFIDITMIDGKTGQQVWSYRLHASQAKKEKKIQLRLYKLAHLVPQRINKYFYRKG